MNLIIRRFEQKLINCINDEPLPIELKRLVLKDILDQVESESTKAINKELLDESVNDSEEEGEEENGNQLQ